MKAEGYPPGESGPSAKGRRKSVFFQLLKRTKTRVSFKYTVGGGRKGENWNALAPRSALRKVE